MLRLALLFSFLLLAVAAHAAPPHGTSIAADAIEQRLLAELGARQKLGRVELDLDNPALHLAVPPGAAATLAVENLDFDARSGRFVAFVAAPADDPDAERIRVSGRVRSLVEVPVLVRPVLPGETIAAGDVERITLRQDRVMAGAAFQEADLVGKTPRRPLRAQEPVRVADLQAPIVVKKNELVTIVLETPALFLSTQGKALEDGAQGAVIRVGNTKSGRVIDAVVTGPNTVTVATTQRFSAR